MPKQQRILEGNQQRVYWLRAIALIFVDGHFGEEVLFNNFSNRR
jgi:hypothetical protein